LEQRSDDQLELLMPAGNLKVAYGEGIWLGDGAQALVQLDRIEPSTGLLALMAALAAVAGALLALVHTPGHWFARVWTPVLVLLQIKVLLGYRASNHCRAKDKGRARAVGARALVPWLLAGARRLAARCAAPGDVWLHAAAASVTIVFGFVLREPMFGVLAGVGWFAVT